MARVEAGTRRDGLAVRGPFFPGEQKGGQHVPTFRGHVDIDAVGRPDKTRPKMLLLAEVLGRRGERAEEIGDFGTPASAQALSADRRIELEDRRRQRQPKRVRACRLLLDSGTSRDPSLEPVQQWVEVGIRERTVHQPSRKVLVVAGVGVAVDRAVGDSQRVVEPIAE